MGWEDQREGRECHECGARSRLVPWSPPWWGGEPSPYVRCRDEAACDARRLKKVVDRRRRAGRLVLYTAPARRDEPGWCRWCGAALNKTKKGAVSKRWHCELRYEGRDCAGDASGSYRYDARSALRWVARVVFQMDVLACVDCGVVVEERRRQEDGSFVWVELWRDRATFDEVRMRWVPDAAAPKWEADHEVPLEDGGEHSIWNLRVRCVSCHWAKTGREATARAAARRPAGTAPLF